jgi:hypothetical protein
MSALPKNAWTIFNSAGAVVADNMPIEVVRAYLTPERFERGWNAAYVYLVGSEEDMPKGCPSGHCEFEEKASSYETAIEEALASLDAGMVVGAADTLREALEQP